MVVPWVEGLRSRDYFDKGQEAPPRYQSKLCQALVIRQPLWQRGECKRQIGARSIS